MEHDIFLIDGNKISSNKIFEKIDLEKYNIIINNEYNFVLENFTKKQNINFIIKDDFDWESDPICKDWSIIMINSLFVADNAYSTHIKYIEWAKKYAFGYFLILLSSTICWNKSSTKRLYFDWFDMERLKQIDNLKNNWLENSELFKLFNLEIFINKSNTNILQSKWLLICDFISHIINKNLISNDFDLYLLIFILSSSIQNNFSLLLNTFELITYNFYMSDNLLIREKYVHIITEKTENDIKYKKKLINLGSLNNPYANYFHINYGYIGQLIRIIGCRDRLIKKKSLLLLRDGHATTPSIYEKINIKKFISSKKIYRIGTSTHYVGNWHRFGYSNYKKGILMGYLTFKKIDDNCCIDDYIWKNSWGKAFTITRNNIEAVSERNENIKLNIYNNIDIKKEFIDLPFSYGMDEFLGTYLAYNKDGLTQKFTNDNLLNKASTLIEWSYITWFLSYTTQLATYYQFVSTATKYIYCKFYDIFKERNILEFYFMCDRLLEKRKRENKIEKKNYIIQALSVLPSIFNCIDYISLNSLHDNVIHIYLKNIYNDITNETDALKYTQLIESKKDKCILYNNINFGCSRKLMYKYNDKLENDCNLYILGYGWQDKIFRNSGDYFDPIQQVYEVNIPLDNIERK